METDDNAKNIPEDQEEEFEAAGSYGQEIQEDETLAGLEGDGATQGARAPEPNKEGSLGEKESPDTTGTNPKRTENSRPQ